MADNNPLDLINRRDLVMGAGMLTMLGMQEASAGGHTTPRELLNEEQQLALEKANDELITNFIKDYASRDVDVLSKYMADDIIYQVSQGQPEVIGVEAYKKRNSSMFAGLEKIDWVTLRQFTVGQLVINDRIDEFYPYPGSRVPRMRFRVAGYFLIDDNKIKVWRDFGYPGAKQLVQPAPKA
jgi:limonene-1,2-epoxide hydrolase